MLFVIKLVLVICTFGNVLGDNEVPADERFPPADTLRLIQNFLGESWSHQNSSSITIKYIRYKKTMVSVERSEIENEITSRDTNPKIVAVRQTYFRSHLTNIKDVLISREMSEIGYGPKFYGVFEKGYVTEFIDGSLVNQDNRELRDPQTLSLFGKKLAYFHCLNIPINKVPREVKLDSIKFSHEEVFPILNMTEVVERELEWMELVWNNRIKSKKVLLHGDICNRGNYVFQGSDPLLIDFENAHYGYRGDDLSQLLFSVLHTRDKNFNRMPTNREVRILARSYLEEVRRIHEQNLNTINHIEFDDSENGPDNIDNLMMEIDFLFLADNNKASFTYYEHENNVYDAERRTSWFMDSYFKQKKIFVETYGNKL